VKRRTLAEAHTAFRVGMRVTGPPEAFGLPPDPRSGICSTHRDDGAYDCRICYPPRATVTVTAVDNRTGTITLDSAAPNDHADAIARALWPLG
jgi:hypothetical protein